MTITFICNEYPPLPHGGIGTVVRALGHGLTDLGHRVTVVGLADRDAEHADAGVRVVSRRSSMGARPVQDRRLLRDWLMSDASRQKTDLVEVPDFEGMLPDTFPPCPVVVRLHSTASAIALNQGLPPSPYTYYCERQTLRRHPHWIAVSEFVLANTRRVFLTRPRSARTIYNFGPADYPGLPEAGAALRARHGAYVLFAAKLNQTKGAFDAARAARFFLRENPAVSLVFVGLEGTRWKRTASSVIRDLVGPQLSGRLIFTGPQRHDQVMAWMTGARVFVAPSHFESFGMTVVEAFQCGVPVVFSRRSPGPELIEHGRNGILVEPGQPREVAGAISTILQSPSLARRLADAGRETALTKFSLARCLDDTLQFYANTISARNGLHVDGMARSSSPQTAGWMSRSNS